MAFLQKLMKQTKSKFEDQYVDYNFRANNFYAKHTS